MLERGQRGGPCLLSSSGGRLRRLSGNQLAKSCPFNPSHTGYDIIGKSYMCEARAEELMNPQIDSWIEKGLLEVHPGDQVDFE